MSQGLFGHHVGIYSHSAVKLSAPEAASPYKRFAGRLQVRKATQ